MVLWLFVMYREHKISVTRHISDNLFGIQCDREYTVNIIDPNIK